MPEPSEELREAAKLMRERAESATPGPWERPLDVRNKNYVMAALPEGEQGQYKSGNIPAEFASHKGPTGRYAGQRERVGVVSAAIWSIGGFMRKRSGRDLDYIASMSPAVALPLADLLEREAALIDAQVFPQSDPAMERYPLAVARAYLTAGES